MEKYDNFINYIENNKIIDEKFILNYLDKDNINFLSNIKEEAYYDIATNQIYVSMENILSHFDETQNKKDLIKTNLNI